MSVFVHAQGIKTVHAKGGGVKKWQNSVHIVVECPLIMVICAKFNQKYVTPCQQKTLKMLTIS